MIITLTGPSCAGKTTLEGMLDERGFAKAISTTTRPKRAGDVDGVSYYFIDRKKFEGGVKAGGFVEHVEFGGNLYGLAESEMNNLLECHRPIVVVCEPVGQKQIAEWCKTHGKPLFAVFVDNPQEVIMTRFLKRMADETWGLSGEEIDKVVATYTRRLIEMTTTEREWVREAKTKHIYNLRLSEFNEHTCNEIADMIADIGFGRKAAVL